MIAKEILKHFQDNGSWVDWKNTVDQFLFGDPDIEVEGMAVSWMSTFSILNQVLDKGCNLLITHEPLMAAEIDDEGKIIGGPISKDLHSRWLTRGMRLTKNDIWLKKMTWLKEHEITVLRCHDFWDNYPILGVHGAWAKFLGLIDPPLKEIPYYELHKIPDTTIEEFVRGILEKTKKYGQDSIQVIGDLKKKIKYITIGTGAATNHRDMISLGPDENGPDAIIISEDGTYLWASAQWAEDTGIPIIMVNHALSEEPGMITLTQYLKEKFSEIPVIHIPVGCLFKSIY